MLWIQQICIWLITCIYIYKYIYIYTYLSVHFPLFDDCQRWCSISVPSGTQRHQELKTHHTMKFIYFPSYKLSFVFRIFQPATSDQQRRYPIYRIYTPLLFRLLKLFFHISLHLIAIYSLDISYRTCIYVFLHNCLAAFYSHTSYFPICSPFEMINGNSRIPKWRCCTSFGYNLWGYSLTWPSKIGVKYCRYLQFGYLKCPLNLFKSP